MENFLKNQQILCGGNTMTFQETEHEEQDWYQMNGG